MIVDAWDVHGGVTTFYLTSSQPVSRWTGITSVSRVSNEVEYQAATDDFESFGIGLGYRPLEEVLFEYVGMLRV